MSKRKIETKDVEISPEELEIMIRGNTVPPVGLDAHNLAKAINLFLAQKIAIYHYVQPRPGSGSREEVDKTAHCKGPLPM